MERKLVSIASIVISLMLVMSSMAFSAGIDYLNGFTYNLVFEETFQKQDSTNKTSTELDENWLFGQQKAPTFIDETGRYQSGWIPGANITSITAYENYKLELDMIIVKGASNGMGVRVPDSEDGALYGGGRAGVPGAADLGAGISFDMTSEGNDGFWILAFNDRSKGMGESPFVKTAYPAGYDFAATNKYVVYDTGSTIAFYVNDVLWARIELSGLNEGLYTTAKVYDKDGTQMGTDMTVSIVAKGRITSYGRLGTTKIDNVKVYDMQVKNAQTFDNAFSVLGVAFVAVTMLVVFKRKVTA